MQQEIRHDTLWRLFQWLKKMVTYIWAMGFAGGSDSKESACNVGDLGLTPGGVHGNPLQYSCLENPHGKRRLERSSLWGCRVCHDWATKHNRVQTKDWASKGVQVVKFSSVQFSHPVTSDSLRPHRLQHTRPPCPSPTPGACSNSGPLSQWCHPTISSSVIPFSSCPQSFPAAGSFQMGQFFTSGAKVLEFQLQYQSFQWTPRTDFL